MNILINGILFVCLLYFYEIIEFLNMFHRELFANKKIQDNYVYFVKHYKKPSKMTSLLFKILN